MPRPRKDGKPSASPERIGRARPTHSGGTWRVRAYGPTTGAPHGRVVWRRPDTGRQTSSVPQDGQLLDDLFEQVERALDKQLAVGPTRDHDGQPVRRDIRALGDLYLGWLESLNRDDAYVRNRRNLLTKWVYPVMGDTLVADWSVENSEKVITNARAHLSPARVEDLGSTLAGLRKTAQRKRPGGRWLDPDDNPLEDVSYSRNATRQGAHRNFVEKHKRPATEKVDAAIEAARRLDTVWDWMPLAISIAAFCALRLGEQLALRAIDFDLSEKTIDINGAWKVQRKADLDGDRRVRFRSPHPKNKLRRHAPYRGSQHDAILEAVTAALGLPAGTPQTAVEAAIEAERSRRAAAVPSGDWRDYKADPSEEAWLFIDQSGLPPTRERFNNTWHRVRDDCGWTRSIPYKNMRHHAALWWKAQGFAWETIADWDGHDVKTLMAFYVLDVEESTKRARTKLDEL